MQYEDNAAQKRANEDQIDLGPLLNWIGRLFKKLGNGLQFVWRSVVHYTWLVLVFIAAGAAVALLIFNYSQRIYYSDMIVSSSYLPAPYYEYIFRELNTHIENKSYGLLASELDIPDSVAHDLYRIYYLPVTDRNDTLVKGNPFRIVVGSFDGSIIDSLTPVVVNYLSNNPFNRRQEKLARQQLQSSISMLQGEITQLDSLKEVLTKSLVRQKTAGGISFYQTQDPVTAYREKQNLYTLKQAKESQLAMADNIILIDPLNDRAKPDEPKVFRLLIRFILIFTGLGIILSVMLFNRRMRRR